MPISNADILDIVRRLRTYMATVDNYHMVLTNILQMEDNSITREVKELMPQVSAVGKKMSVILKLIENNKLYKDMVKSFNIKEEPRDEDDYE